MITTTINKQYLTEKEIFKNLVDQWKNYSEEKKVFNNKEKRQILEYLNKSALFIALYIVEEYKVNEKFLYDVDSDEWYEYEKDKKKPFLWLPLSQLAFENTIEEIYLQGKVFPYDIYIKNKKQKDVDAILHELKKKLSKSVRAIKSPNLIVRQNIVYDQSIREVKEQCGPMDYIFNYSNIPFDPKASCPQITKWMNFVFRNDQKQIQLFQAISQVVLLSNKKFNLQFFVEIKGLGRSGKSLCGKLLQTLIDPQLVTSTNLQKLHMSKYESAKLVNKNLVLMSDQAAWVGEADKLKALTGGDINDSDRKYKSPISFVFHGVIVIITNQELTYSSTESAILRRRIVFNFNRQVDANDADDHLLNINDDNTIHGKWQAELPGFVNWILEMPAATVSQTIRHHLSESSQNVSDSPLLWWVRNNLMPCANAKAGVKHRSFGPSLYDVYEYCMKREGHTPLKPPKFASTLETDFGTAFPGYEIILETIANKGKTYRGVTFQHAPLPQLKPDEQRNFLIKWRRSWEDSFGQNFFGVNNVLDKDQILIDGNDNDKAIYDNPNLKKHLYNVINSPIHDVIGVPRRTKNDKKTEENVKKIDNDKIYKETLEFYVFDEDNKITTESLFENYQKVLQKYNTKPKLNKTTIKNEIKEFWNKTHPDQLIQDAKNITRKKLKGLRGLKER